MVQEKDILKIRNRDRNKTCLILFILRSSTRTNFHQGINTEKEFSIVLESI